MSSIAYVTDEKMLEYHRISRNRTILFWRLSSNKNFSDFHKGDLLFFYSRSYYGKRKGLIGYAHFNSTRKLSISQMWKNYREATGYGSEELLTEAIQKAARGNIPETMSCLYLTDVVFFMSPIYPEEVGIELPVNLESYYYLDRKDPNITIKILRLADQNGIDLWSEDDSRNPEDVFHTDVVRHQMAAIADEVGKDFGSERERAFCERAARKKASEKGWERIRRSETDCMKIDKDTTYISIPFAAVTKDKDFRKRELLGRMVMYRTMAKRTQPNRRIVFEVITEKESQDVIRLVEEFNNGQL